MPAELPKLQSSTILDVSLRMLFPFVVLLSFEVFSYGANAPGGGFQAGVIFGTIVVILEVAIGRRIFSNSFYHRVEVAGVGILLICWLLGWALTGHPFAALYGWTGPGLMFSNVYFWFLNLAIYLEVAGSIVLIFRHLIEWDHEIERT